METTKSREHLFKEYRALSFDIVKNIESLLYVIEDLTTLTNYKPYDRYTLLFRDKLKEAESKLNLIMEGYDN